LVGLSKDLIWDVFMEIELPQSGPVLFSGGMAFPTIGAFYDAISHAYGQLPAGAITGERQIQAGSGTGVAFTIASLADATHAIERIKQQGEGSAQSPIGDPGAVPDPGTDDLAHYYQFAEIYYGRRLKEVDGLFEFTGDPVAFPAVHPMAEVPPAGYLQSADFDAGYKAVLDGLQTAWEKGDQDSMDGAVGTMFTLGDMATTGVAVLLQPAFERARHPMFVLHHQDAHALSPVRRGTPVPRRRCRAGRRAPAWR
jgi:hypothetical protein